ncbi:MAG: type II secretion system F family protein [Silicimonas sp.]|uniref:type II secretion system F family protein n=1 Tax=Roseovarius sp. TaxID=1486281 RepID=UPI0032EB9336
MSVAAILAILMFSGTVLLLAAVLLRLWSQATQRLDRLRNRFSLATDTTIASTLPEPGGRSLRREDGLVSWATWGKNSTVRAHVRLFLKWLGSLSYAQWLLYGFVCGMLIAGFTFLIGVPLILSAVATLVLGVAFWSIVTRYRRQKRHEAIAEKVPEAIDVMVRALRVGSPFSSAITLVGKSMEGPIAEEFTATIQEVNFGQDLVVALHDLAERCDNQDLRFLAAGAAIQQTSGGNLAELLERISKICRGRQALALKVRSLTSEARWSGNVLSIFPIIAVLGITLLSPNYFDEVSKADFFPALLTVVGALLVANILFMRRMLVLRD